MIVLIYLFLSQNLCIAIQYQVFFTKRRRKKHVYDISTYCLEITLATYYCLNFIFTSSKFFTPFNMFRIYSKIFSKIKINTLFSEVWIQNSCTAQVSFFSHYYFFPFFSWKRKVQGLQFCLKLSDFSFCFWVV